VTQFRKGDAVFGVARGTCAEYVCASQSHVVAKPANVSFEQAAAVPVAGLSALQSLRDKGHVRAGDKVLINGAAGGVGTFAVQIAKSLGADVTGVCSTRNVEIVRSIGANHVIDYTRDDFTKGEARYDVIIDCVGNHSFFEKKRVVTPRGVVVMVGGPARLSSILRALFGIFALSLFTSRRFARFLAKVTKEDLTLLAELLRTGKVTPVLDTPYRLSEVVNALRHLDDGHARGKIVVSV
jgi:NADPH:quinone reductase-like Zn-dependent oxidoreductase